MSRPDGRVSTGIDALDTVLHGGLLPQRGYMVSGGPGAGKSILGMQFLWAGVENGESALYVNLEEPTGEIRRNADSVDIDLEGVTFLDLSPQADRFADGAGSNVFTAAEVEAPSFKSDIVETVEGTDPDRVFVDPIDQFRDLTPDQFKFRMLVSGFVRFLQNRGATVLFSSKAGSAVSDDLEFICDGTLRMRYDGGRTIEVRKLRGSRSQPGEHTVRLSDDGIEVYPKLVPESHGTEFSSEQVASGVDAIDDLLHGGVERGTVTMVSGPSGVGKTTLGAQFMAETAARGERSVIYMFEEATGTFLERSRAIGLPVAEMLEAGNLVVEEVEPLDLTPDEFAHMVRTEVEEHDARTVMIDGIDGYRLSLRGGDDALERELHALGRYLKNMGATALLVDSLDQVTGDFRPTQHNVSYLADTIVFLRYIEMNGQLRKAIGVLKKRTGDFERTLREFEITDGGIRVGEPLRNLRGILSGTPEFLDREPD